MSRNHLYGGILGDVRLIQRASSDTIKEAISELSEYLTSTDLEAMIVEQTEIKWKEETE